MPKIVASVASFCSLLISLVLSAKSRTIALILRGPLVSFIAIPRLSNAALASSCCAVASLNESPISSIALVDLEEVPAKRKKPERKAVPAADALIPLLAISPVSAAVSSKLAPKACATGAAYFIVSPNISTVVFVLVVVLANTSAIWPACSALNPKAVRSSDTISAVRAKSVLLAAAKFKSPGIPAMIC